MKIVIVEKLHDVKTFSSLRCGRCRRDNDAAWSQFREWLEYFGKVFGVPVITVVPHFTSQDCSSCEVKVQKTLSTRTHKCISCGHVQDRDWNAAVNILKKALQQLSKNTVGHTEINVSGENDLCFVEEIQPSKPTRRKRKPLIAIFGIPTLSISGVGRMSSLITNEQERN